MRPVGPVSASALRHVEVTWYGQAAFRLRAGEDEVLVDPFLSSRPDRRYPPPVDAGALRSTTAVLCTHEHDDHLDLPFLYDLLATGARPTIVLPAPVVDMAIAGGLERSLLFPASPGERIDLGGVAVHPVPAFHGIGGAEQVAYGFWPEGAEADGHRYLGYVVDIGGVRLYHAGDTLLYDEMPALLAELAPDVAFLPINGRDFMRESSGCVGNLNPDEAAWLCREVGFPVVIPMHYECFANNLGDVARFAGLVEATTASAMVLLRRAVPFLLTLA